MRATFGEDDGRPYIVFDLVPGDALAELYSERLMPWRELCVVVLDLLAALDELHRRGITHRDVKPDNVFVVRTLGDHVHVTLLDLGFAAVPPERRSPAPRRTEPQGVRHLRVHRAGAVGRGVAGAALRPLLGRRAHVQDADWPAGARFAGCPALICIPSPRVFVPTLPEAVDATVMRALSDVEARFRQRGGDGCGDPRGARGRGQCSAERDAGGTASCCTPVGSCGRSANVGDACHARGR